MFVNFLMLVASFSVVAFICKFLLPHILQKYKSHKELKEKKKRRKAFGKKMKELEIK